jgi:hypothetical protein
LPASPVSGGGRLAGSKPTEEAHQIDIAGEWPGVMAAIHGFVCILCIASQRLRHCEEATDLGFTRDRQPLMRKSGKPDLRGRRSNLRLAVGDCFGMLCMPRNDR